MLSMPSQTQKPSFAREQDALYAALGAAGGPGGKVGAGTIVGITLAAAVIAAAVGLAVHKLRMRHVMQSEIRSIMSQYMPLVRPGCVTSSRGRNPERFPGCALHAVLMQEQRLRDPGMPMIEILCDIDACACIFDTPARSAVDVLDREHWGHIGYKAIAACPHPH